MAYIGLDTTQYERTVGTGSSDALPVGFYSGVITRAEMKNASERAKDPNGKYVEVEFDITEPSEMTRRKFWDKFNVINTNATATKIGREHLSDLAQACGISSLGDTEELLGKECCFYLMIEPARGDFKESNKCMKYLPSGSSESDYEQWFASKRGAAKASTGTAAPVERKAWGAAPAEAAKAAPASGGAPWSTKK